MRLSVCVGCGKPLVAARVLRGKHYCAPCYQTAVDAETAPSLYDAMVEAKAIIKDPSLIDACPNKYWVIWDYSMGVKTGIALNQLQEAINLFVSRGWTLKDLVVNSSVHGASGKAFGLTGSGIGAYAVMEAPESFGNREII